MKKIFLLCIIALLTQAFPLAQKSASQDASGQDKTTANRAIAQQLPPAAPFLSKEVCGKGAFLISMGEQSLGRETFEITCKPDGAFAASGNTRLEMPPLNLNQDTTIEVDKEGVPLMFTAKGEAGGSPVDQKIIFQNDKAVITSGGATNEIPYANKAVVVAPGVHFLLQFIGARYDTARGGPQEIALFPNLKAQMERTGRDEVTALRPRGQIVFDRYSLQIASASFIIWTDERGRIVLIYLPAQKFAAVREEYAPYLEALLAALVRQVKGILPDYSAPEGAPFTAEEVRIPAKGFTLAGTLLVPKTGKRPFPAVVMSTGSGQQMRDSQLPGLEKYRPFRQIAEYLASRGIAVLRADDRGVGDSGGLNTLLTSTTFDFADDVRAQIAYLRTRKEIHPRRIAIIGHSEGGLIAPMVAATDKGVAAIVVMAGTALRGEDILRFQLNYEYENNAKLSAEEKAKGRAETESFLRAIRENGDVSKFPLPLRGLSSPWGRAFLTYDPLPTMRKVSQPILILQGEVDQQVTMEQARMLERAAREAGNRDVTTRIFPRFNHLFLPATSGAEREYTKLETYSLSEDFLKTIADWLRVKLKAGK